MIGSLRLSAIAAISAFSLVILLGFPQTASASTVRLIPTLPMASLFHFSGPRPTDLGVTDGQLKTCPSSPNCVSSQSRDAEHSIAAIVTTTPKATLDQIATLIEADASAQIITRVDDYINAEYTSDLMGFVDDVEFWANAATGKIEVRSASRLGESDLGVNRKRIEAIRAAL
ncbi:MAG: DUF1499 domain-containing protein [Coleofasciculaceae cyanobacterium RL_1_1]|nr:DUF1499 domain-containing protein [Coleofasciculaceae cyanobacterium RL_1_1]